MNLSERARFFSEPFLSPRDELGMIELGILPNVEGLYKGEEERAVDAVVLSHSHIDHSMCVSLLNRKIPVYCGETTRMILESLSSVRPAGFENDLEGLVFHTFRTGDRVKVNGLEIEPVHVDHSVPGAYGFVVHTSEGTIAYSGDFRAHGPKASMTWEFAGRAREAEPEVFLCEGTNLVRGDLRTEMEVLEKVDHVVGRTRGLVLANFSGADIDRLRTFHEAARRNGRVLAVSLRQAFLLRALLKDPGLGVPDVFRDPNIVVYRKLKKTYYKWEQEIINSAQVKTSSDVRAIQEKIVLVSTSYDMNELLDIRPGPGSSFINSTSEPFNEELEMDHERFVNWLNYLGLPLYQVHSSGHMMPTELRETVSRVGPRRLVPIHTEQPELFGLFVKDLASVEQVRKGSVLTL
jgi:ribonuclease J